MPNRLSSSVQVGLFTALCLVILGWLIFRIEDLELFGAEGSEVVVAFPSVVGLDEKSPVRVAGVRVGTVEEIFLEDGRARVRLSLDQEIPLNRGARASIANAGILGDKYVELIPGPPDAEPLPDGAVVEGETPVTFDQALARFDSLGRSLQELTGDVSARGDLGASIRRLLDNLEATSENIRQLVAANREQIDSTVGNLESFSEVLARELPEITSQTRELLAHVDSLVVENRGEIEGSLQSIERAAGKLDATVENLNGITAQIESGEGTVGKLIYDDEAHESLVSSLDSVKAGVDTLGDTLGRVQKLELQVGLEGALYSRLEESDAEEDDLGDAGARFDLRFSSHPRRYYLLGITDQPQGQVETETRRLTTTFPDGTTETTVFRERVVDDDFTVNAMVGYSFDRFDLRGGVIESTGGGAVDFHFADRRVELSLEAFDFSRPDDLDPHLRLTTRFHLNPNIYVLGGYDDPLAEEFESVFFGAGIRWKDDDLKYLLGAVPAGGF